jgi:hypothetical protein
VSDNKKALESMLEIISRRSKEIIELPESEREARYKLYWTTYYEAGWDAWGEQTRAENYADKIVEFVRALVKFIDTGGGAAGGPA